MKVSVDDFTGQAIKRGDILQTNIGDRRERTFLILRVHRSRGTPKGVPRYQVWAERWWQIEPDLRIKLHRSAERAGGQQVVLFQRYRTNKKSAVDLFA
jgi:hypothetical protein